MLDKLKKNLVYNNVFLSGGAGVGKSFLTNELIRSYRKEKKSVVALGSSALSAFNIGGITLHSFFCLGYCEDALQLSVLDRSQKQKDKLAKLKKVLKTTDLIIIDEISMVSANVFEMLGFRLKNSQFNGKILVVGDFFQLPPVIKKKKQSLFSNSYYAFSSFFWKDLNFKNLMLSQSKRTQNIEFYNNLSLIRQGFLDETILNFFQSLQVDYKQLQNLEDDYILLCGINKKVNYINKEKLNRLCTPLVCLKAEIKKEDKVKDEELLFWVKSLNILEELNLKIGARIIFCVNNWDKNYYNGEQGVVQDIINEEGKIYINIMKNNGIEILLEPYTFFMQELEQSGKDLFIKTLASVTQFPIKLAYAITIHKSQGMSIEKLVCDIDHIFENGQLYVALSRSINPNTLKIYSQKRIDFRLYFANILKIDSSVIEFYKRHDFVDLQIQE
ncbi:AAA family ATPase [Campylobacter sp. VicNov18]|uniref:ATP-dependent DNA helicase n=1 Tax=Campylobacter bilis TaxID=2691918 RepID=UPI00130EAA14|nr:AAA family ATPase [Campylobacter bilis]MPV63878.1 AAA family ATPase [Campylobacter hepaticus]MBM0637379.1 AAA family ATPase [Campylobacter bilis]MCC8278100.1 AAA family ATPase [Campylobacter bilis]MCC8299604.1 AAA family ATPase [Campylobacter bilis]MCC8301009.1 AAA family ATPase [Campylobacter bilis]